MMESGADRTLDGRVAEDIFEWQRVPVGKVGAVMLLPPSLYAAFVANPDPTKRVPRAPLVPRFSAIDSHAFHAADTVGLFQRGYEMGCTVRNGVETWFIYSDDPDERTIASGPVRAAVVCNAALRVKRGLLRGDRALELVAALERGEMSAPDCARELRQMKDNANG